MDTLNAGKPARPCPSPSPPTNRGTAILAVSETRNTGRMPVPPQELPEQALRQPGLEIATLGVRCPPVRFRPATPLLGTGSIRPAQARDGSIVVPFTGDRVVSPPTEREAKLPVTSFVVQIARPATHEHFPRQRLRDLVKCLGVCAGLLPIRLDLSHDAVCQLLTLPQLALEAVPPYLVRPDRRAHGDNKEEEDNPEPPGSS